MTQEEKAKAYDNALKRARLLKLANPDDVVIQTFVKDSFPELGESEDERIRKDLIKYLESDRDCQPCQDVSFYDNSIAWLERYKEGNLVEKRYIQEAFNKGMQLGMKQKKVEWSEEDEKKRNLLIDILKVNHPNGYFKVNPANTLNMEGIYTEELVAWLESLYEKKEK